MKNESLGMLLSFLFVIALFSSSCKEQEELVGALAVSSLDVLPAPEGDSTEVTITCDSKWTATVNNTVPWITIVGSTAGEAGAANLKLRFSSNGTGATRNGIVTIKSPNGQARRIKISQINMYFPSYNISPKAPDATGMGSTAMELAAKMHLGINIGNTFEAPGNEQGWGSPIITEDWIKAVKQHGFNAIRIPVQWNWHHQADSMKAKIDPAWLTRIHQVVKYCTDNDMYVFINIHWDGGWMENNCTPAKKDSVAARTKAFWEQIATKMRDFDEHLMFANANEPNTKNVEEMKVLLYYHKTFINAVRSTGGRNTYRCLILQGTSELLHAADFPHDPTPNRLMFEEHNYTPFQFTLMRDGNASWGKMFYYWGVNNHSTIEPDRNPNWDCEETAQAQGFDRLKREFIDKGIPVMLGEYGAYRRNGHPLYEPKELELHNKSVDHWIKFTTNAAVTRGIVPFWWDTGGLIRRNNGFTVGDQRSLDKLKEGAVK